MSEGDYGPGILRVYVIEPLDRELIVTISVSGVHIKAITGADSRSGDGEEGQVLDTTR